MYAARANGNVAPDFILDPSNSDATPGPFGVAVDDTDKVYAVNRYGFTQTPSGNIMVYAPNPSAGSLPIATIQGPQTGLSLPTHVAFDRTDNLYVENDGLSSAQYGFTVYSAGANGDAKPIKTIVPTNGKFSCNGYSYVAASGIAVDDAGFIYSSLKGSSPNLKGCQVLVYPPGMSGPVAPVRTISGNRTELYFILDIALHRLGHRSMRLATQHF